jgi:hypothetical protein
MTTMAPTQQELHAGASAGQSPIEQIAESIRNSVAAHTALPMDTPVWVRNYPVGPWQPRHATSNPGYAWRDGLTSHTIGHCDGSPASIANQQVRWNFITTTNPFTESQK